MDLPAVMDVPRLLGNPARASAGRSLLTFYDDATGERTELSAVALGSWAARTSALVSEGCGLVRGDRAAVLLPPHWQTAAVLLGTWAAGVAVSVRLSATDGLAGPGTDGDEPLDAVFVSRGRLDSWLSDVPAARHRFVLRVGPVRPGLGEPPTGYRDYLTEVRDHSDEVPAYESIRPTDAATADGTTFQEWIALAQEVAAIRDLGPGDRILVDADEHEHPVHWLLAPLSVGASVVLCANLDRALLPGRIAAETVTHVL
jgi:uncharacterized protein (TIGR03089 family)